jgi:hypothetical protein
VNLQDVVQLTDVPIWLNLVSDRCPSKAIAARQMMAMSATRKMYSIKLAPRSSSLNRAVTQVSTNSYTIKADPPVSPPPARLEPECNQRRALTLK